MYFLAQSHVNWNYMVLSRMVLLRVSVLNKSSHVEPLYPWVDGSSERTLSLSPGHVTCLLACLSPYPPAAIEWMICAFRANEKSMTHASIEQTDASPLPSAHTTHITINKIKQQLCSRVYWLGFNTIQSIVKRRPQFPQRICRCRLITFAIFFPRFTASNPSRPYTCRKSSRPQNNWRESPLGLNEVTRAFQNQ